MRSGSAIAIGCFSLIIGIVITMTLVALKTGGTLSWCWAWVLSPLWGIMVLELPFLGALALYAKLWGMGDEDAEEQEPTPRRD